jgi:hypothetical protein
MQRRFVAAILAVFLLGLRERPAGQQTTSVPGRQLVGTWTLVSAERLGTEPSRVANPRGLLVLDAAGHALEIVTQCHATFEIVRLLNDRCHSTLPRWGRPVPLGIIPSCQYTEGHI